MIAAMTRPLAMVSAVLVAALAIGACSSQHLAGARLKRVPTADLERVALAAEPTIGLATPAAGRARGEWLSSWMSGPASVIATEQERLLFAEFRGDSARAEMIQQFWQRRDPQPGHPVNEYLQEMERRVATADAAFGSGSTAGWNTPFGVALLVFGFPYTTANLAEGDDTESGRAELGVPIDARDGDRIVWAYAGAFGSAPNQRSTAGVWPVTTLGFRYNRGQWRLGCQIGLIASAALSTGIQGWYAGGSTYGSGSWSGGDGSGLGSNEIRFDNNPVAGSGAGIMGPLLGYGPATASVYRISDGPILSPSCQGFFQGAIAMTLRNPVPYAALADAR